MKISVQAGDKVPARSAMIAIPVFVTPKGRAQLDRAWANLCPPALRGALTSGDFTGKPGSVTMVHPTGGTPGERLLLVGLGKASELTAKKLVDYGRRVGRRASQLKLEAGAGQKVVALLPSVGSRPEASERARWICEGLSLGSYRFDDYQTAGDVGSRPKSVTLLLGETASAAAARRMAGNGLDIGYGVNLARQLGNLPPNALGPVELAAHARREARGAGLKCSVMDEKALRARGMGALLGVAQGSVRPARLITLEHRPAGKAKSSARPLVFVGKAITFDTGGISIKPSGGMEDMKFDMCGGAAVIGALVALAKLDVSRPVVGIIAAAENMPDGAAYRPGDIVKSAAGLTIEIINTDAEGRLALADGLHHAKSFDPELVIDVATLTGACVVALGHYYSGVFTGDEKVRERILGAADRAGESMWPLPVDDDFAGQMKSKVADLKNSGGRWGGASSAAAFLQKFIEGYPWAHLDIAGTADTKKTTQEPGATGAAVRTLIELARSK